MTYPTLESPRERFIRIALELEGIPYVWNKDSVHGADCSGFVNLCLYLAGGPKLYTSHNTDRMWRHWEHTENPEPGDLCIYGLNPRNMWDVEHVMILMPAGRVYGACGGGSRTTNTVIARAIGARVQYRDSVHYRPDFRGYLKLPLLEKP